MFYGKYYMFKYPLTHYSFGFINIIIHVLDQLSCQLLIAGCLCHYPLVISDTRQGNRTFFYLSKI